MKMIFTLMIFACHGLMNGQGIDIIYDLNATICSSSQLRLAAASERATESTVWTWEVYNGTTNDVPEIEYNTASIVHNVPVEIEFDSLVFIVKATGLQELSGESSEAETELKVDVQDVASLMNFQYEGGYSIQLCLDEDSISIDLGLEDGILPEGSVFYFTGFEEGFEFEDGEITVASNQESNIFLDSILIRDSSCLFLPSLDTFKVSIIEQPDRLSIAAVDSILCDSMTMTSISLEGIASSTTYAIGINDTLDLKNDNSSISVPVGLYEATDTATVNGCDYRLSDISSVMISESAIPKFIIKIDDDIIPVGNSEGNPFNKPLFEGEREVNVSIKLDEDQPEQYDLSCISNLTIKFIDSNGTEAPQILTGSDIESLSTDRFSKPREFNIPSEALNFQFRIDASKESGEQDSTLAYIQVDRIDCEQDFEVLTVKSSTAISCPGDIITLTADVQNEYPDQVEVSYAWNYLPSMVDIIGSDKDSIIQFKLRGLNTEKVTFKTRFEVDDGNCKLDTLSKTVFQEAQPSKDVSITVKQSDASNEETCEGQKINLELSGEISDSATYFFSVIQDGMITSQIMKAGSTKNENNIIELDTFTVDASDYTFRLDSIKSNRCESLVVETSINQRLEVLPIPQIEITATVDENEIMDAICFGDDLVLSAEVEDVENPNLKWVNELGNEIPNGEINNIQNDQTYTVSFISDGTYCSAEDNIDITVFGNNNKVDVAHLKAGHVFVAREGEEFCYKWFKLEANGDELDLNDPDLYDSYIYDEGQALIMGDRYQEGDKFKVYVFSKVGNSNCNIDLAECKSSGEGLIIKNPKDDAPKVKLYPNPVKNELFLITEQATLDDTDELEGYTIVNQVGKVVKKEKFAKDVYQISGLEHLPAGLYFLQITTKTGQTLSQSFILDTF